MEGRGRHFSQGEQRQALLDLVLPQMSIHRTLMFLELRTQKNMRLKGPTQGYTGGGGMFCSMVGLLDLQLKECKDMLITFQSDTGRDVKGAARQSKDAE